MHLSQIYQITSLKKNTYDLNDSIISENLDSDNDFKSSDSDEQTNYLSNENISDSDFSAGSNGTEEDSD